MRLGQGLKRLARINLSIQPTVKYNSNILNLQLKLQLKY